MVYQSPVFICERWQWLHSVITNRFCSSRLFLVDCARFKHKFLQRHFLLYNLSWGHVIEVCKYWCKVSRSWMTSNDTMSWHEIRHNMGWSRFHPLQAPHLPLDLGTSWRVIQYMFRPGCLYSLAPITRGSHVFISGFMPFPKSSLTTAAT